MRRYLLRRFLWAIPTLLGISFVTFLLVELAPGDRAVAEAQRANRPGAESMAERHARVRQLRIRYKLIDADTGERRSLLVGYGRWLLDAVRLRFSGPTGERFGARIKPSPHLLVGHRWLTRT